MAATCHTCGNALADHYGTDGRVRPCPPKPAPVRKPAQFVYDDGGRRAAGYQGDTGDCVVRAAAIATGRPYQEVYDLVNQLAAAERPGTRTRTTKGRSSARTGVHKGTTAKLMDALGLTWTPTMQIGSGCTVHLRADELPAGRLVVSVSRHLVAVVDGVIHDLVDCSRDGTRCVYGYWKAVQR